MRWARASGIPWRMGRFLVWAFRWIGKNPPFLVLLVKFTVVLSIVLGALTAVIVAASWIGGPWFAVALMMGFMLYPLVLARRRRLAAEPMPTARSLPPRRPG